MRKPMIGLLSVLMACSVLALGCSKSNETAGKTSQTQSKSVKTINPVEKEMIVAVDIG
jgi:hypothetical protein